ncbi:unnamed protein product [Peniophora sp. CBMAI 1063]|nr:unnamed protein product [Peniophora sp. CBMAI 1063]
MHASTVALALFAATQILAAPTPANSNNNARSLSAIENFFSNLKRDENLDARSLNVIEGLVDDIFNKRSLSFLESLFSNDKRDEQLDARSLTVIENFLNSFKRGEDTDTRSLEPLKLVQGFRSDLDNRSLKAVGAAVAGGVASGVAGAVASNVLGRSELSGLMVDTETGTIYADIPDANEVRSLKAVGAAVAGGVASGVAGAVASNVLGRFEPSGLMVDTDTGIIYMDVSDAPEGRSLKAVGAAVAGGVASGVAGAVASNVLGRSELSGLMVDTETGVIYMDVPDAPEGRSLKAVGAAVAGGVASGVAGAVASNVLGRSESGLMVDTETGTIYMDIPDENGARSLKAVGAAVAGGVATGLAGAVASDVLGRSEPSGIMVDTETGTIYMDVPDANEGRSLKAVGAAVAGGVASGVAGAVASNVLGRSELSGLMVDTDTGVIYMDVPDELNARSPRAIGTFNAGGAASLLTRADANEVLGNDKRSLSVIEGLVDDIFNKRSLSVIEGLVDDIFNKRSIDDLE